jgi:hypothetical protein
MERFKSSQWSLLVSAVAVTAGFQQNGKHRRCYGIYDAKGGPMYEASVGGQTI